MLRFAWYSQRCLEHACEAPSTLREGGPIRSTNAVDSSTTLSPRSFTVATQQVLGSISTAKILTSDNLHTALKEDLFRCTQYTFGWPSYISSVRVIVFMQCYHATCDVLLRHSGKIPLYVRVYAVAHSYLLRTLDIMCLFYVQQLHNL